MLLYFEPVTVPTRGLPIPGPFSANSSIAATTCSYDF